MMLGGLQHLSYEGRLREFSLEEEEASWPWNWRNLKEQRQKFSARATRRG